MPPGVPTNRTRSDWSEVWVILAWAIMCGGGGIVSAKITTDSPQGAINKGLVLLGRRSKAARAVITGAKWNSRDGMARYWASVANYEPIVVCKTAVLWIATSGEGITSVRQGRWTHGLLKCYLRKTFRKLQLLSRSESEMELMVVLRPSMHLENP